MRNQRLQDFLSGHRAPLWASMAAFTIFFTALQIRIFDRTLVAMDEGQLTSVATRILDGEVLYRDVHTGIGPGIFHVIAALFAAFGRDLIVTRVAQIGVNIAIATLLWLLAARVMRLRWAAFAPSSFLLLSVVAFPVFTMLNYSSLSLTLALASLLVFLHYLKFGRTRDGIVLGAMLALTALTKQNYGALAIIAIGLALAWNRPHSPLASRSLGRGFLPIVAGGGTAALIVVAYFAAHGALPDLISATLIDLSGPQLEGFNNPIPSLFGPLPRDQPLFVFLYTPPTMFNHMLHGGTLFDQPITPLVRETATRLSYGIPLLALATAPFILWWTGDHQDSSRQREARVILLFSTLFFLGIFPSAIWSHLAFVAAPAMLALALILDRMEGATSRWRPPTRGIAIALSLILLVVFATASIRISETIRTWFPTPLALPGATVFVTDDYAALFREATDFVEKCASPGEPIFVAPDMPIIYLLTGRKNPTPYDLTIPGNVDEEIIIERLESTQTRCIVYNPKMYPEFPPLKQIYPRLDRYLRSAYRRTEILSGTRSEWHGLVRR